MSSNQDYTPELLALAQDNFWTICWVNPDNIKDGAIQYPFQLNSINNPEYPALLVQIPNAFRDSYADIVELANYRAITSKFAPISGLVTYRNELFVNAANCDPWLFEAMESLVIDRVYDWGTYQAVENEIEMEQWERFGRYGLRFELDLPQSVSNSDIDDAFQSALDHFDITPEFDGASCHYPGLYDPQTLDYIRGALNV